MPRDFFIGRLLDNDSSSLVAAGQPGVPKESLHYQDDLKIFQDFSGRPEKFQDDLKNFHDDLKQ